jgi:hypothetical protein
MDWRKFQKRLFCRMRTKSGISPGALTERLPGQSVDDIAWRLIRRNEDLDLGDLRFGCESPAALRKYWGRRIMQLATRLGFKVQAYKVDRAFVSVGKYQLAFVYNKAEKVQVLRKAADKKGRR